MENCKSLSSEPFGEFGEDSTDCSVGPRGMSPMDQRLGRAPGVTEISGSDDKCMLCRYVTGRAGVEVLRGIKLCGMPEVTFEDNLRALVLVSSRRRSKLLVDLAGLRDDKLRNKEGVTGKDDVDDDRLLSLALDTPVKTTTKFMNFRL